MSVAILRPARTRTPFVGGPFGPTTPTLTRRPAAVLVAYGPDPSEPSSPAAWVLRAPGPSVTPAVVTVRPTAVLVAYGPPGPEPANPAAWVLPIPGPTVTPVPVTAADLIEALAAFLAADPVIAGLYPGGWWHSAAARDAAETAGGTSSGPHAYGVFQVVDVTTANFLKPGYFLDSWTLHFWTLAPLAEQANAIGRQLRPRLLGKTGYTPAALVFTDGTEANRYAAPGGVQSIDDERPPGVYGSDCFRHLLPVVFVVARGG